MIKTKLEGDLRLLLHNPMEFPILVPVFHHSIKSTHMQTKQVHPVIPV